MNELYASILGIAITALTLATSLYYLAGANEIAGNSIAFAESVITTDQLNAIVMAWQTNNTTSQVPTCLELQAQGYVNSQIDCAQLESKINEMFPVN